MYSLFVSVMLGLFVIQGCSDQVEERIPQDTPVRIQIGYATLGSSDLGTEFSGTIESALRSEIATKVTGTVEKRPVAIGDRIKKGALLVKMRDADVLSRHQQAEATRAEARAQYTNAEKDRNRFKILFEQNSATLREWEAVNLRYETSKANLNRTEERVKEVEDILSYTSIKAPYDGVIASVHVQPGDLASPGQPLVTLEDENHFKLVFTVPETTTLSLHVGDTVSVRIPAIDMDKRTLAIVSQISRSGNGGSRQFLIEATLPAAVISGKVRSGMHASIFIPDSKEQRVFVPKTALVERGQLRGIFTVRNGQEAMLRWVRIGRMNETHIEILSGLREGESFVLNSNEIAYDGQKIQAVTS